MTQSTQPTVTVYLTPRVKLIGSSRRAHLIHSTYANFLLIKRRNDSMWGRCSVGRAWSLTCQGQVITKTQLKRHKAACITLDFKMSKLQSLGMSDPQPLSSPKQSAFCQQLYRAVRLSKWAQVATAQLSRQCWRKATTSAYRLPKAELLIFNLWQFDDTLKSYKFNSVTKMLAPKHVQDSIIENQILLQ